MNPANADISRLGMRRWAAVILSAVFLIGIGLIVKKRESVERVLRVSRKWNPADEGGPPDPRTFTPAVITEAGGGEAASVAGVAPGKLIFEQSNGRINLRILSNGTYQVSMPGRQGEFRTWEGLRPLDTGNYFRLISMRSRPAGLAGAI